MVALSTSGKSREVLEMLELARHLGVATVIGITSHPDSDLRALSDLILDMGVIEEPCPPGPDAERQHRGHAGHHRRLGPGAVGGEGRHPRGLRAAPTTAATSGRRARTDNLPH